MALARKLKDLAADKITVPSTEEMLSRRAADIAEAKANLANIGAGITKIEANTQRKHGDTDKLYAERAKAKALVERLQNEAGLLKDQLRAAKPEKLTAWGEAWAEAAAHDPYAHIERGSAEKIAEAQAHLDNLIVEYRLTTPTGAALDAWTARKHAARTRLEALRGAPYPAHRPWASDETLKAARLKEGFKS
jgi:chromosome segregation ATPase